MKTEWNSFEFLDLLIIEWNDIVSVESWMRQEDAEKFPLHSCKTVGWLLNQDKQVVRVVGTVSEDNSSNVIVIPKSVITKVQKVNYDRE